MTTCDGCGLDLPAHSATLVWVQDELVAFHTSTATATCARRALGKTRIARQRERARREAARPTAARPRARAQDLFGSPGE